MNSEAQLITEALVRRFPTNLKSFGTFSGTVPIGIEVECSWRSYFPDLLEEGFPNIPHDRLQRISEECSRREETLVPMLQAVSNCGLKRGADRYWEFAFPPVFDVGITCQQVQLLKEHKLIPEGSHSLHVTLGGLPLSPDSIYLATILESFTSSKERILSGFHHQYPDLSSRWGRKGMAGCFQKEGAPDLEGGYEIATEMRLLALPDVNDLEFLLSFAQRSAELILTKHSSWKATRSFVKDCLRKYDLPDKNWKKPHEEPAIWKRYAEVFEEFSSDIRRHVKGEVS